MRQDQRRQQSLGFDASKLRRRHRLQLLHRVRFQGRPKVSSLRLRRQASTNSASRPGRAFSQRVRLAMVYSPCHPTGRPGPSPAPSGGCSASSRYSLLKISVLGFQR